MKVQETHKVKSVEVVKSEFNSGYVDRKNIANGNYDTYLMIKFEGGGYTKVRIGYFNHEQGGMCQMFFIDSTKNHLAEEVNEKVAIHSSTWGATGTCTMMSQKNEIRSKINPGDVIIVSGRKTQTKFSWKITHAEIKLVN